MSVNSDMKNRVEDMFLVNHDELVEHLEKSLHEGIVKFEFVKVSDGSIRQAFGTLKGELVPNKADKIRSDSYVKISEIIFTGSGSLKDINAILTETDEWFRKSGESNSARTKTPDTVVYYDLEAQSFRSLKKENLLTVYA